MLEAKLEILQEKFHGRRGLKIWIFLALLRIRSHRFQALLNESLVSKYLKFSVIVACSILAFLIHDELHDKRDKYTIQFAAFLTVAADLIWNSGPAHLWTGLFYRGAQYLCFPPFARIYEPEKRAHPCASGISGSGVIAGSQWGAKIPRLKNSKPGRIVRAIAREQGYGLEEIDDLDEPPYLYQCELDRVIDGDTLAVYIDLGFGLTIKQKTPTELRRCTGTTDESRPQKQEVCGRQVERVS